MSKKVVIVLADGFEEIEAVTSIDVLRRAGLDVVTLGVGKRNIEGAHGIKIETDALLEEFDDTPDAIILPGGMPGSENLSKSKELVGLLQKVDKSRKVIGAICAAPALVLAPNGFLTNRKATCYPSFESKFNSNTTFSEDRVVVDGHFITSRGPGSSLEFSLEIVRKLIGEERSKGLAGALLTKALTHILH